MRVRVRSLKRFLIVGLLTVGALSVAGAALADYTGPNRNIPSWSWDRLVCDYLAEYDPAGPGNALACTLTLYEPPDGNCPSNVVAYFNETACGWTFPSTCPIGATCDISRSSSTDSCNQGQEGCREVERIVSQPPARIRGNVTCGIPGSGGWCRSDADLVLLGSEPLSGYEILALEWTHNGATFACSGAACEVSLVEGGNNFSFWAVSSYGDTSNMGSASGSVDSEDPSLSGSASGTPGDNGSYVSSVTVEASAGDGVSGLASLDVQIDGGVWSGYGGPVMIGDGSHDVELRAVDVAGNSTSESFSLDIDTQSPIADLDAAPSFCPRCGEALDITVVVQDGGSGIAAWSLEASGISVASGAGAIGETITWNGGGIGGGVHTLELEGRDAAGNSATATFDFSVIVPTPRPKDKDEDDEEAVPFSLPSPTALATGTTVGGSGATRTPVPTRTPVTVIFGGPPAAPQGPAPGESISNPQSPPTTLPAATSSSVTPVLYGAAAAALIATAMAIGLDQKRRREAEEARRRAEMAAANRKAEAEEAEWRAMMGAILAAAEAARRAKTAVDDARMTRMEARLEPNAAIRTRHGSGGKPLEAPAQGDEPPPPSTEGTSTPTPPTPDATATPVPFPRALPTPAPLPTPPGMEVARAAPLESHSLLETVVGLRVTVTNALRLRTVGRFIDGARQVTIQQVAGTLRIYGPQAARDQIGFREATNWIRPENIARLPRDWIASARAGLRSWGAPLGIALNLASDTQRFAEGEYDRQDYAAALTIDTGATIATALIAGAVAGAVSGFAVGAVGGGVTVPFVGAVPGAIIGTAVGTLAGLASAAALAYGFEASGLREMLVSSVSDMYHRWTQ